MKNVLKLLVFFCLYILFTTSCERENVGETFDSNKVNSSVAIPIDIGCNATAPSPFDQFLPDSDGNVFVNQNITLTTGNTYILHNYVRILSGYTITIEPGVHILGNQRNQTACDIAPGALIIERGAKIDAQGTVTAPIVFTANKSNPVPGDWAGVMLLGKAHVNAKADPNVPGTFNGVAAVEGLPVPANIGLFGSINPDNNDDSGIMRYVRIEYAGDEISAENEFNSLTLAGVGSGTTLEYIQISYSFDDAFAFIGGSVNGKYLIANRSGDDDFDTNLGYSGNLQFGVIIRDQNGSWLSAAPLNGSESKGDDDSGYKTSSDFTKANFSNFTIIGPYQNNCLGVVNANYSSGIYFIDNSDQNLYNSVILGFGSALRINDAGAANFNTSSVSRDDRIDIRNTTVVIPAPGQGARLATLEDVTGTDFNSAFLTPALNNSIVTAFSCSVSSFTMAGRIGFSPNAWNSINNIQPDLRPNAVSSLPNSASFTGVNSGGFFDTSVTYRGAFGRNDTWMDGWTDWTL
ncbi:hypothetical protein [Ascidiimonas aurantiaca]|uniref:hypothetical protein n=1 Tax=Ascidiimonas aurantiaca TaxID=1685432 RepID=UPI0030EB296B